MAGLSPLAWNLKTDGAFSLLFLKLQDSLLVEKDKKLPPTQHVVSTLEHFCFVGHLVLVMLVRTQKVVISNPEGEDKVGNVDVIKNCLCNIVRFSRSIICLNGQFSIETESPFISLIIRVILKVKYFLNFLTNSMAARG